MAATVVKQFVAAELKPAQKIYENVLRRAYALATAQDVPITPEESQKPDSLAASLLRPIPDAANWMQDAGARDLHQQHANLKELADALALHRRDSEVRIMSSERSRQDRAGWDPSGKYVVRRRFQCYGRPYEVGVQISSEDIPLSLLEKLYSAKSIAMLERFDQYQR